MATIQVVENPRRKKRRRYTRKQIAAGFGGRRKSRPTKRRRRRNPMMASLGNPSRRRTYRRRSRYTVTGVARRRRRNPMMRPFNIDLASAAWVGVGVLSTEFIPQIVKGFWSGLPTFGAMSYLVKAGAAVGAGMLVGKFTNSRNGSLVTAGGLSMILVDLFRQYAAPHLPFLSGMGGNDIDVTAGDIEDVYGVDGYVETPTGVGAYVDSPVGIS